MGWLLADRKPRPGGDPWLRHKMALLAIGGVAAALGIALDLDLLVDIAIGVLAVGLVLRFLPGRRPPPE